MAVTGLLLFGFVFLHMVGMMKFFFGQEDFDHYSHWLRTILSPLMPHEGFLWLQRGVLSLAVVLHMWAATSLTLQSRRARPVKYARRSNVQATYASRTMRWGGVIIILFVIYHLLDLSIGNANPGLREGRGVPQHRRQPRAVAGGDRLHRVRRRACACTCTTASGACSRPSAPTRRSTTARCAACRKFVALLDLRRLRLRADRDPRRVQRMTTTFTDTPWVEAPSGTGPVLTANVKADGTEIDELWDTHRFNLKLVNPANKRKHTIIMVGTGLAGGAAAASLGELGYHVKAFCYQDSPRRAHSIAAQGGINAAKNYRNDGDSVYRLFYDTVKGGDFRARESNVYRLAQLSVDIIDQCVAQGVPFAREYGGLIDTRSFGGAQLSRTFYARGQTGQQLLLGAYQALERQIDAGTVEMHTRSEMLEVIVVDGRARGIVVRDMVTGAITSHIGDAVVLCTGGYGNVFFLSTNAKGCNATAIWRAHRKGALFANPCFTQIHPTCIPVSRRPPVEAHADERVVAQRRPRVGPEAG